MLISELSFPHLQAAREARLTDDLERRRVVQERLAEAPVASGASSERMPQVGVQAIGTRGAEACPA